MSYSFCICGVVEGGGGVSIITRFRIILLVVEYPNGNYSLCSLFTRSPVFARGARSINQHSKSWKLPLSRTLSKTARVSSPTCSSWKTPTPPKPPTPYFKCLRVCETLKSTGNSTAPGPVSCLGCASGKKQPETDIMMMCKKLIYWVWFNLPQICILHGVGLLWETMWKRRYFGWKK